MSKGFTLIEMLVVVAIIGIVAAAAAPSFSKFIQKERHSQTINQLQGLYKYARSEAVKREQIITVVVADGSWQVLQPDNNILKQIKLPPSAQGITVSGFDGVVLSELGTADGADNIAIADTTGVVATKYLCIWPSGQAIVQGASCA